MPDQGQSERPSLKEEPPRIKLGQEVDFSQFYNQDKTPKIIFGRAPRKFTDQRFKAGEGQKNVYAYLSKDTKISRSQVVLSPQGSSLIIENPTKDKNIWVSTSAKKYIELPPNNRLSLGNDTKQMRNLKILFARLNPDQPGYILEATSVSGSNNKALQKLRFSKG